MARSRDYDEYDDRRPRQRSSSRRARDFDDYDEPRRSSRAGSRRMADRRPAASRRVSPTRRAQRRKKKEPMSPLVLGGAITNFALLAVIGAIYFLFPATWQRLIHFRDSGPAQLAAGADLVVLAHTVPWGALTLENGAAFAPTPSTTAQQTPSAQPTKAPTATATPQASPTGAPSNALQPTGTAGGYPYFRLARGTHTLVYTATPFATLRCQISVPAAGGDTCPIAQVPPSDALRALGAARVVDAHATVDQLPTDSQKALFTAIAAALTPPPTTVRPYERYLNASKQITTTYSSLQATLQYAVNTDPTHAIPLPAGATGASAAGTPSATASVATPSATPGPSGTPAAASGTPTTCVSLCEAPATADAPADAWNQIANLIPSWSYQPSHGAAISGPVASQGSAATSVAVSIRWNGQWQVSAKDGDKAGLLATVVTAEAGALHMPNGWSVAAYPAANPADGYLVVAGPSSGPSAQLLYRFGVLLSVNSLAYSTFPSLPRASSTERTEAGGIKTQ